MSDTVLQHRINPTNPLKIQLIILIISLLLLAYYNNKAKAFENALDIPGLQCEYLAASNCYPQVTRSLADCS